METFNKERERQNSRLSINSLSAPKVNVIYSGLRLILQQFFVEICLGEFV